MEMFNGNASLGSSISTYNDFKKEYIFEKTFSYINDFGDQKDFSPLRRNLANLALTAIFPSDLSDVFISVNNDYILTLNNNNKYANKLDLVSHLPNHPYTIFKNNIINEYLIPIENLYKNCPYCFVEYTFCFKYGSYCLYYKDDVIGYLRKTSNREDLYFSCVNCLSNVHAVQNQEYINLLKCKFLCNACNTVIHTCIIQDSRSLEYALEFGLFINYNLNVEQCVSCKKFKYVNPYPSFDCRACKPLEHPEYTPEPKDLLKCGDIESNPGPVTFDECKDFVTSIPNILSYEEVMTHLKPINTITSIYKIYKAPKIADALAEILRLTETHGLYWSLNTEKLIACIDCICSLVKNIRDVPDIISKIPGMDRNSNLPGTSNQFRNMDEQSFTIDEEGLLAKALNFGTEFGLDPKLLIHSGPIVALLATAVASLALIGCGSKINTTSISSGISQLIHTMAIECKDWKVLLNSLKDTWQYIASALGKFLGFTYEDDKTAVRTELITRLETLKNDIQKLEDEKELNYSIINDPMYFDNFQKRFKDLEKLLIDMIKTDQNLVSFRLVLDKLRTRVQVIKDDYVSLFNSKCGKQQPTTIYIGSELSGIGKTTFMEWCVEPLSLRYGRQLTKYVKGQEDYWSNYVYQDILHWRDFNQKKTNEEHIELINIYDPSPTQLNMSDNDQKGRQFKSRFMFIDSNSLYIRRSAMIEDGSKLDRRRDFLFEAFTEYVGDANNPTPRSEKEAIDHLYLVSRPKIKQETGSNGFNTEYFTIDGRNIKVGTNLIATQKFEVIIDALYEHEIKNNQIYAEKCQRIFQQERQKRLMQEQTLQPAISRIDAESKKVILLIGEPGTGKTTLARRFNNGERFDGRFAYDEFVLQNTTASIRQYILNAYDSGHKDVVLTSNGVDFYPWIDSLPEEARDAILRRCIKIDVKFNVNKKGWLNGYLTAPTYYTKEEVLANPSLYSRMVAFVYEGINIKITGATELIDRNIKKDVKKVISYDYTPRIKINKDMAKNLVKFDMYWRDVDEIKNMSMIEKYKLVEIIRTEIPLPLILKSFASIVTDVFSNYTLCSDLDSGLNQLNSLRITSPLEFDCVIKLKDEAFFLTTDDEGKLVFCLCDDSFEYKVSDDGRVLCYHYGEYLWEVEGRIASWYRHIQRNVDMVVIDYANVTPPSRNFVLYCDYFLNFLKTGFAAFTIHQLCKTTTSEFFEETFDTYDQSFTRKPTSYQSETSADSYLSRSKGKAPQVNYQNSSKFKMRDETTADAYLQRSNKHDKVNITKKSQFKFKNEVRKVYMENEACQDIQSAQLADIVMRQNWPLYVGGTRVCYAQGMFDNYMVTVGHLAGEAQVKIDGCMYDTKVVAIDAVRDLAIVRVLSKVKSLFKDIRKYCQKERLNNSVNGFKATLYCWSESGNIYEKPITLKEQRIMEIRGNKIKDGLLYNVNSLEGNHPIQTQAGFCGSPLLICNASYPEKFLGLHIAADDVHGLTSVIFKDDLYFSEMYEQCLTEDSITVLPFQQAHIEDCELPVGLLSPLKCIGKAGKYVDGVFIPNKAYSSNKTQIYPSPFSTDDEVIFEPSILSEKDPRLEEPCANIIYEGLNKFAKEQKPIDIGVLDECVDELTEVLLEGIKRTGMRTKVFNLDEVVNGCSYYTTSPSLNMSSGVGYPHSFECRGMTHKADAFYFDNVLCKYVFAENEKGVQIKSDVDSYLDFLQKNDNRTAVIYVAQKKDEVLKIKKIRKCGTRIFEMGPLYHFMAMKMYFGAAQSLLTYVNSTIPFKIGINASSREYSNLYKFLSKTGTNGMNCDYTGFDSSHPFVYLERYHKIYNTIYRETDPDWKEEDDIMRRRLHNQENRPLVLVDDNIIECPGGLMSGGEDTGGKNNIAGNLNMRYAWKILSRKYCQELYYKYDEYTTDATFGDDLIKTIHDDVLPWYNPTSIQNVLSEIGFSITSADKETELTVQPLNELTFLKRSFVDVEVELNGSKQIYKVGALEDNCFVKMLNWCKVSKRHEYKRTDAVKYDPTTIGLSALTCLSEASLKGKDKFLKIRRHLLECAEKYNILLPRLPTFEQAFFETYFCSNFPQKEMKEIINIPTKHYLHPLTPRNFRFADRNFTTIMQCYEFKRAMKHHQKEKAEKYYNDPNLCKYVYYPNNDKFNPDSLMRKIIKCVFKDYDFNIDENQRYIVDYGHKYFGFQIGDAVTNKFGELLTEFALNKLSKNNFKNESLDTSLKRSKNPLISKENIILDSDFLVLPELYFNTTKWKTAEITPLSQKYLENQLQELPSQVQLPIL